jgi:hypothetical protein
MRHSAKPAAPGWQTRSNSLRSIIPGPIIMPCPGVPQPGLVPIVAEPGDCALAGRAAETTTNAINANGTNLGSLVIRNLQSGVLSSTPTGTRRALSTHFQCVSKRRVAGLCIAHLEAAWGSSQRVGNYSRSTLSGAFATTISSQISRTLCPFAKLARE